MKNNFSFLVIIALIVAKSCESIEVIFRHHVYDNDLKKTLFNCTIRLKEDREVLTRLTISKDTQDFYTLAANDPNYPLFKSIAGIDSVQPIGPGLFVLSNPNKTTGGQYVCKVDYTDRGIPKHKDNKMPITITENLTIKTSKNGNKHKTTVPSGGTTQQSVTTLGTTSNLRPYTDNIDNPTSNKQTLPGSIEITYNSQQYTGTPIETHSPIHSVTVPVYFTNTTDSLPEPTTTEILTEYIEIVTESTFKPNITSLDFTQSIVTETQTIVKPTVDFRQTIESQSTLKPQESTEQLTHSTVNSTESIITEKYTANLTEPTIISTQFDDQSCKTTLINEQNNSSIQSTVKPIETTTEPKVTTVSNPTLNTIQTNTDKSDKEIDTNLSKVHVSIGFRANRLPKGKDAYLACSYDNPDKPYELSEINIYKGEHLFWRQVNQTFFEFHKIKGINKIANKYESRQQLIELKIRNVQKDTFGEYTCKVTYHQVNSHLEFSVLAHSHLDLANTSSYLYPSYFLLITFVLQNIFY